MGRLRTASNVRSSLNRATNLGTLAFFCSRPNLFNYFNPYLTDVCGALFLFLVSIMFILRNYYGFLALALVGLFVRESVVFATPAWLLTSYGLDFD